MRDVIMQMAKIEFEGNIIPTSWYKNITFPNGRADLVAITILADIVYWYRPVTVYNESTGEVIGYTKKFKADKLQKSYQSLANKFSITKRQAQQACKRLEQMGLITIEYRTVEVADGITLGNVTFLEPVPEAIAAITHSGQDKQGEPTRIHILHGAQRDDDLIIPAVPQVDDAPFVIDISVDNYQDTDGGITLECNRVCIEKNEEGTPIAYESTPSYIEMQEGIPTPQETTYSDEPITLGSEGYGSEEGGVLHSNVIPPTPECDTLPQYDAIGPALERDYTKITNKNTTENTTEITTKTLPEITTETTSKTRTEITTEITTETTPIYKCAGAQKFLAVYYKNATSLSRKRDGPWVIECPNCSTDITVRELDKTVECMHCALGSVRVLSKRPIEPAGDNARSPAVRRYMLITGRKYVAPEWVKEIDAVVDDVDLWGLIVKAYVGMGWNAGNISKMLEYYKQRRMPGKRESESSGHERVQQIIEEYDPVNNKMIFKIVT